MSGTDTDARLMGRALELAQRARGLTSPNPLVGAVVVSDGEIVGEGFHRRAGEPHAEVEALAAAGSRARGATLYITLEPCVHHGRTPPCVPEIVAAGIRRVVAAIGDPNPVVAGRGFEALRAAGVEVTDGVLAPEAFRANRVFVTAMREHRPHVTMKAAMTLDGKIADIHGASKWITGETARAEAHRLRSEADAIVVGIGTILRDDPELTVRLGRPWPREPYRVVLDSRATTPPEARLIQAGEPDRAVIAVGAGARRDRIERLQAAGASVVRCPARDGRVDLESLLVELFSREVRGVLVEGGGQANAAFVEAGLVDRVVMFIAPLLLGGREAPSPVDGIGRELKSGLKLQGVEVRVLGEDMAIEADVVREGRSD